MAGKVENFATHPPLTMLGNQDIAVGDGAADDVADEGDEEEDAGGL